MMLWQDFVLLAYLAVKVLHLIMDLFFGSPGHCFWISGGKRFLQTIHESSSVYDCHIEQNILPMDKHGLYFMLIFLSLTGIIESL